MEPGLQEESAAAASCGGASCPEAQDASGTKLDVNLLENRS